MSEIAINIGFVPVPTWVAEAPTVELPAVQDEKKEPVITPNHFVGVGDYALKYLDTHPASDSDSHYSTEQTVMTPDYVAYEQRYIPKHVKERAPARHVRTRSNLTVSTMARLGLFGVESEARHA